MFYTPTLFVDHLVESSYAFICMCPYNAGGDVEQIQRIKIVWPMNEGKSLVLHEE